MERNQRQRQAAYMRNALFDQGYRDDQYIQLEDLQDEANPTFVEEVVHLFYSDSARFIKNIELTMHNGPFDFEKLDNIMHQFKGGSSSIGAKKVKKECTQFQECCKAGNFEGWGFTYYLSFEQMACNSCNYCMCMKAFQEVKQEHAALRRKLESYLQIAREAS